MKPTAYVHHILKLLLLFIWNLPKISLAEEMCSSLHHLDVVRIKTLTCPVYCCGSAHHAYCCEDLENRMVKHNVGVVEWLIIVTSLSSLMLMVGACVYVCYTCCKPEKTKNSDESPSTFSRSDTSNTDIENPGINTTNNNNNINPPSPVDNNHLEVPTPVIFTVQNGIYKPPDYSASRSPPPVYKVSPSPARSQSPPPNYHRNQPDATDDNQTKTNRRASK